MKTKSTRPDIRQEWSNKKSGRFLAAAGLAVAALLTCNLANSAMAGGAENLPKTGGGGSGRCLADLRGGICFTARCLQKAGPGALRSGD